MVLVSLSPIVVVTVCVVGAAIPRASNASDCTYLPSVDVRVIIPSAIVPWIPQVARLLNKSSKVALVVFIVIVFTPVPFCITVNALFPLNVVNTPIVLSMPAV